MITYEILLAAKQGDSEAMAAVTNHYTPYIRFHSKRSYFDRFGNRHEYIDEDIREQIEAKLMYQIVFKFDPTKLP